MFRRLVLAAILLLIIFIAPSTIWAQEDFGVDARVNYEFSPEGVATVTHAITLTNENVERQAVSYSLNLNAIDPTNVRAFESELPLRVDTLTNGHANVVTVFFDEPLLGLGSSRKFSIVYEYDGFANNTGRVWGVSVPKLVDDSSFDTYSLSVNIPKKFGPKAYMSPGPALIEETVDSTTYFFDKLQIVRSGVAAGFGDVQVFTFSLKYHLENPLNKVSKTSIAIPADTQFQRVRYKSIDPLPSSIYVDQDGNWMAEYELNPRQKLDVSVDGDAHIYASPVREAKDQDLDKYLQPLEYWESDDSRIAVIAKELETPAAIYDYVVNTLTYDTGRVRPNIQRLGALKALNNPDSAICMEFTDLFIALSRAAGIPAREINGFAYTENPLLQPLSLVADVLHSWPEYWDEGRGVWTPVDPTWGATSGSDYFNKLDMRHFAFVTRGVDSKVPYTPGSYKLGPNPQKDVFVEFGTPLPIVPRLVEIEEKFTKSVLSRTLTMNFNIRNPSGEAMYSLNPILVIGADKVRLPEIDVLLPFDSDSRTYEIPIGFLGVDMPESIDIAINGQTQSMPINKPSLIFFDLLTLSILLVGAVGLIYVAARRVLHTTHVKKKTNVAEKTKDYKG